VTSKSGLFKLFDMNEEKLKGIDGDLK